MGKEFPAGIMMKKLETSMMKETMVAVMMEASLDRISRCSKGSGGTF